MDRLLTKTRALLALVLVLGVAALNRSDPILYAMGLTLAVVAALGYAMPWLALRGATLVPAGAWREEADVMEGEPLALALRLRQPGWWPAWMVEIEAQWAWAGKSFVTRDSVAFLPPRGELAVLGGVRFACRGRYRLAALRMRSGFPLGLVEAAVDAPVPALVVRVRPAPAGVQLPAEWTVSEDAAGDQALGHAGESLELNMLRPYQFGDAARRVDWRASARAGELIVRQFQHPASVLVKVMVELPGPREVGLPQAPAEHAVRAAMGACAFLGREGVRTQLLLPDAAPVEADDAMPAALAGALPGPLAWDDELRQAAKELRRGQQILAVVAAGSAAAALLPAASEATAAGARLLVLVATWPGAGGEIARRASDLREELKRSGVEAWLAWQ